MSHPWQNRAAAHAFPLADLETVITCLTSDTVIVQMEQNSYDKLAAAWELPQ